MIALFIALESVCKAHAHKESGLLVNYLNGDPYTQVLSLVLDFLEGVQLCVYVRVNILPMHSATLMVTDNKDRKNTGQTS